MKFLSSINIKDSYVQLMLLVFLLLAIFIIPLFPDSIHDTLYNIIFSIIVFLSIFSLKTGREKMLTFAIFTFAALWITRVFDLSALRIIASFVIIAFFIVLVIRVLIQIARSKVVDEGVIAESISGYLLMGLLFSFLVDVVIFFFPDSVNFPGTDTPDMAESMYFTFVTMSTLGYGDVLPTIPITRSLSILVSVSGQIYLTVIIAMLVGKYISLKQYGDNES